MASRRNIINPPKHPTVQNNIAINRFRETISRLCRRMIITGMCAGITVVGLGQQKNIFSPEIFIGQVVAHHPVAKQAAILKDRAGAQLLAARGAFDPVAELTTEQKTLDGTNYYRYTQPMLKIPTAAGATLKAGWENSEGPYINPEKTNGVASYVGVDIAVLNGLFMDKKRAVLRQAKLFLEQSEQEQRAIINDLLLDAYTSYWDWAASWQLYKIYTAYVEVASQRMRLVRIAQSNGDRSVGDTIEAATQLMNYQLMQSAALMDMNNKLLELSLFLWTAEGETYLLPENYEPAELSQSASMPLPDSMTANISANHPEIQIQQFKLKTLEVERRLKLQALLPLVNLQANLLSKDYFRYDKLSTYYLENNYKYGVRVQVPIFFRQGRGDYRDVKLKIRSANLELEQKTWQIQTKLRQYHNEAKQLQVQISQISAMLRNYRSLLSLEELRFTQGESSLFLVNSRESKMLETEQKLIELQQKYIKAVYSARWAAGLLVN